LLMKDRPTRGGGRRPWVEVLHVEEELVT